MPSPFSSICLMMADVLSGEAVDPRLFGRSIRQTTWPFEHVTCPWSACEFLVSPLLQRDIAEHVQPVRAVDDISGLVGRCCPDSVLVLTLIGVFQNRDAMFVPEGGEA